MKFILLLLIGVTYTGSAISATVELPNDLEYEDSVLPEDTLRKSYPNKEINFIPLTADEMKVRTYSNLPPNCPQDCPPNTVTVGDECFRFVEYPLNWSDAKKDCEAQQGHLAIPDLSYLNFTTDLGSVYRNIIGKSRVWIGANDLESYIAWKWINGAELSQTDPTWYPGHPGSYPFNSCAQIYTFKRGALQISKETCTSRRSYLCEFHKSGSLDAEVTTLRSNPDKF